MARHTPAARRLFLRTGAGTIQQREAVLGIGATRSPGTLARVTAAATPTPARTPTTEPIRFISDRSAGKPALTVEEIERLGNRVRSEQDTVMADMEIILDSRGRAIPSARMEEINAQTDATELVLRIDEMTPEEVVGNVGRIISRGASGVIGLDPRRTLSSQIGQQARGGNVLARVGDRLTGGHFTEAFSEEPLNWIPCIPKSYAKRIAREIKRGRMSCG